MLVGRHAECARLDALLTAIRGGRSAALVVLGEAGVGKSALLDYAIQAGAGAGAGADATADAVRVLRATGVESEMELPYAALHQLCLPLLSGIDRLPTPQAEALARIFGLRGGDAPSPFFVWPAATGSRSVGAARPDPRQLPAAHRRAARRFPRPPAPRSRRIEWHLRKVFTKLGISSRKELRTMLP